MELIPIGEVKEKLAQDFDIAQIPYTLGKTAKVSKATLKRLEKVLPFFPESLKNFLIQYSNFRFSWSDGKINITNALGLVQNLENSYDYEVTKVNYIPLVFNQNTQLLAQLNHQELELFLLINIYVSGKYQRIVTTLDWTLEKYLKLAIEYKGIPFWEFLELDDIPSSLSFLAEQKEAYKLAFKHLFHNGSALKNNWQSIINQELSNNSNIRIKKIQFESKQLYIPTKIEMETQLGHSIHPSIAQYYQYIRNEISFNTHAENKTYASTKIIGFQELLYRDSGYVWNYLGISKRNKNKKNYYLFKVFIMQEAPIFIDLKSADSSCLYYYDYSEKELYPIQLPFDLFLYKYFQCKAVNDWERLFIGKSYLDETIINNIKIVNPDLDIDTFLEHG